MSKKKKKKGEKKISKKDRYAHLRHRGEYKPKEAEEGISRAQIQQDERTIGRFYRFSKFGRVNKRLRPKNTKKKMRL